jgi:hypothetical protein
LRVGGPEHEVCRFAAAARGEVQGERSPLDFHKMKPAEDAQFKARYGYGDKCEWACAVWGTKWNANVIDREGPEKDYDDEWVVRYSFDTACSPPLPLIKRAAELYPSLSFDLRYYEGAMGFHGMFVAEGSQVTTDESAPYYGTRGG